MNTKRESNKRKSELKVSVSELFGLEEVRMEEREKYEQDLAVLRNEYEQKEADSGNLDDLKQQLENELKEKTEELEVENKYKIEQEQLKLDMEREKILEEYEDKLKQDLDKELENIQKSHEASVNSENREFEIQKLKQDQFYEHELERQKNDIKNKFQHQLDELEEEKSRKIIEIEASLKDMSLSNENPDLVERVKKALKDQKSLESQIGKIIENIDAQKFKSKQISSEIIDLNRQILEKEKLKNNDKGTKITKLRDQLDRVDSDLIKAETEYQKLLEDSKHLENDSFEDSDLNERVDFNDNSGHARPANNASLDKLAQDISDIKTLIEETGIGRTRVKDYLLDVEDFRRQAKNAKEVAFEDDNLYLLRDQLRREKAIFKRKQKDIEREKKKWREDKILIESNPELDTTEKRHVLGRNYSLI